MKVLRPWCFFLASTLFFAACGEEPVPRASGETPLDAREPLSAPTVRLLSPPVWTAGDTVTVIGSDFVGSERGYVEVTLEGTFTTPSGEKAKISGTYRANARNSGKADFVFEPVAGDSGLGSEVGFFVGEARATNVGVDERSERSESVAARVEVGPSLIAWRVGPAGQSCGKPVVDATLDGQKVQLDLEAIGLAPAAGHAPLEFRVAWVDADGAPKVIESAITAGRLVRVVIEPGKLPAQALGTDLALAVSVTDGEAKTLQRSLRLGLRRELTVDYDGNVRVAELYDAVPVSGCLPGGEFGRSVTYSASSSESRSRTVGYSVNLSVELWILNASFGFNVSDTVTSSQDESLSLSGRVLPGQFGVFYRQTQRLERKGKVLRRDACGATYVLGDAIVTDWDWAPDLALTSNGRCPPAPPSNLPPAQVFP